MVLSEDHYFTEAARAGVEDASSATTDTDLVHRLEGLKGCVVKKLDKIGEIIYSYGAERFGVKRENLQTQKEPSAYLKSRRQKEIKRLVKERRCLRKKW